MFAVRFFDKYVSFENSDLFDSHNDAVDALEKCAMGSDIKAYCQVESVNERDNVKFIHWSICL